MVKIDLNDDLKQQIRLKCPTVIIIYLLFIFYYS